MNSSSDNNIKTHVAGVLTGLRLAGVNNLSSLGQAVSVFNLPSSVRLSLLANLAVDLSEISESDLQAPSNLSFSVSRKSISPSKEGSREASTSSPPSAFKRPLSTTNSSISISSASTSLSSSTSSNYAAGAASRHLPAIFNSKAVDSTYHYYDDRQKSPPKNSILSNGAIQNSILSPTLASLRSTLSPGSVSSASPGRMALLERARREGARMVAQRQMDGEDRLNDAVTPGSSLRPTSSPSERIHAVIQAGIVSSTPSYSATVAMQPSSTITPLRAPDFASVDHIPSTQTEATQTETVTSLISSHDSSTVLSEPALDMSSVPVTDTIPIPMSTSLTVERTEQSLSSDTSSHIVDLNPIVAQPSSNAPSEEIETKKTSDTLVESLPTLSSDSLNPSSTASPELPVPTPTPEPERETHPVPAVQSLPDESLSSVVGVSEGESTASDVPSIQTLQQSQEEAVSLPSSDLQAPASPTPTFASSGRNSPSKTGYLNIIEVTKETDLKSTSTSNTGVASTNVEQTSKEPTPLQKAKLSSVASKFGGAVGASSAANSTTNSANPPRPAIGARPAGAAGAPLGGVKPSMGFSTNPAAEAEKKAKEAKEAKKAAEEKKLAEVKARQDKEKADKAEKERLELERKAKVAEKAAADKLAAEKVAAEKVAAAAAQREALVKAAVEKTRLAAFEKAGLTPEQAKAKLAAMTAKEESDKKSKAEKEAAAAVVTAPVVTTEPVTTPVVSAPIAPIAPVVKNEPVTAPVSVISPEATSHVSESAQVSVVQTAPASKAPSVAGSVAGSVVSTAENLATTMQISEHGHAFYYKHMSRLEMKNEAIRRGLDPISIEENSGEGKGAKTKALRAALKSDDILKGHDGYDSFSQDLLLATISHRGVSIVEGSSIDILKAALRKHDEENANKEQVVGGDEHS